MAYLNAQQREQLRQELLPLKLGKAKGRVKGMDRKSRLVLYRNMQRVGQFTTLYELPSLGIKVALIEGEEIGDAIKDGAAFKKKYDLLDVTVEPTPDNKE